jgi:S-DNA-T family DNA segregation ATPase FtsK/SpoIIIE
MKTAPHWVRATEHLKPVDVEKDKEDLGVERIEDIFKAFRVKAKVTGVQLGPSVIRYKVKADLGVSVKKITDRYQEIGLALKATTVHIAPVPGQDYIGIDIPRAERQIVRLREIISQPNYYGAESKLTFALGKGLNGQNYSASLEDMPHLLVAGATNSGKSVFLNSLISSLLLRATPDEVRFILIDPKRVELTPFNQLPHLMRGIITDPEQAIEVLQDLLSEMESRYKLLETYQVRNIQAYNATYAEKMPYIVVVIDELADLMLTSKGEIEVTLCRLAQLARATGIHLVVATQRPSTNIITGLIKANFPSRISFALPSHHDSRTIIDQKGAENLTGKGDMLYMPQGCPPIRLQGAFVDDEEIDAIVAVCTEYYSQSAGFRFA